MSRHARFEYDDVQSVIDTEALELGGVSQELAGTDLGDARLSRRLVKTEEQFAKSPASPINEACATWPTTPGAYRLFNNTKATPAGTLAPHVAEMAKRVLARSESVLVMQDTPRGNGRRRKGWVGSARATPRASAGWSCTARWPLPVRGFRSGF